MLNEIEQGEACEVWSAQGVAIDAALRWRFGTNLGAGGGELGTCRVNPFRVFECAKRMRDYGWQGRPVLVYGNGDACRIIDGYQRCLAARAAGIDVVVLPITDKELVGELQGIEREHGLLTDAGRSAIDSVLISAIARDVDNLEAVRVWVGHKSESALHRQVVEEQVVLGKGFLNAFRDGRTGGDEGKAADRLLWNALTGGTGAFLAGRGDNEVLELLSSRLEVGSQMGVVQLPFDKLDGHVVEVRPFKATVLSVGRVKEGGFWWDVEVEVDNGSCLEGSKGEVRRFQVHPMDLERSQAMNSDGQFCVAPVSNSNGMGM